MADNISIQLSREQALVLFEWLTRTVFADSPTGFEDQAEKRVLWDLQAALESVLTEPLRDDYVELLATARGRLRDTE